MNRNERQVALVNKDGKNTSNKKTFEELVRERFDEII